MSSSNTAYNYIILLLQPPGGPDECQVAADAYQCARDVEPAVTDEIFTRSKGNSTMVGLFN
jgi:hypothetical protein